MIESPQLARAIGHIAAQVASIRDALNAADRELGDGDTGMTIAQVVGAWHSIAATLPDDVGEALVALGRETSRASGSSLGAVLATGLGAAGRSVRGRTSLDRDGVVTAIAAAVHKIGERSGATAGAKTVLDSLLRMDRDARGAQAYGLDAAIASCRAVLDEFRDRVATIGRARMYGDGSRGHDDPGMLAALLILRAARG